MTGTKSFSILMSSLLDFRLHLSNGLECFVFIVPNVPKHPRFIP